MKHLEKFKKANTIQPPFLCFFHLLLVSEDVVCSAT